MSQWIMIGIAGVIGFALTERQLRGARGGPLALFFAHLSAGAILLSAIAVASRW